MDLSSEQTHDSATLNVIHPTKGKTDIKIELAGRDSDLYQKQYASYREKLIKKSADRKESKDVSKDREIIAEFLARITLSWENVAFKGEPLECNYENAYKIYNNHRLTWLRDAVDDFSSNRGNYLGN